MNAEFDELDCTKHGKAHATYVCEHLIADPVQKWHSDYPDAENPWPDAWCAVCNAHYETEGEWSERNENLVPINIACHVCYDSMRTASLDYVKGLAYDSWRDFVDTCIEELQGKINELKRQFSIGEHERHDWCQDSATLVFSNDSVTAVIADIDLIGSYSTTYGNWLWAWGNFHVKENFRKRMLRVREFGEKHEYPWLNTAKWKAETVDAWEMAAVAAHVLDAKGVYRSPHEGGASFLLIREIRKV